jgi:hypothetical protein
VGSGNLKKYNQRDGRDTRELTEEDGGGSPVVFRFRLCFGFLNKLNLNVIQLEFIVICDVCIFRFVILHFNRRFWSPIRSSNSYSYFSFLFSFYFLVSHLLRVLDFFNNGKLCSKQFKQKPW